MQPKTWDFSLAFNIKFIERIGERDDKFSWQKRLKNAPKTRRLFKIGKVGKPTIFILLTYDKARWVYVACWTANKTKFAKCSNFSSNHSVKSLFFDLL